MLCPLSVTNEELVSDLGGGALPTPLLFKKLYYKQARKLPGTLAQVHFIHMYSVLAMKRLKDQGE